MNKVLATIAVVLVLAIYAVINFTVATIFGIQYWLVAILFVLSIVCLFLVRLDTFATRWLYIIGMTWMGAAFIAVLLAGMITLLHIFLDAPLRSTWYFTILVAVLAYAWYNAFFPHVKRVEISLKKKFKPITLVQLSDVHVGEVHGDRFLAKVVAKVNTLKPDAVVITGDLFDGTTLKENMLDELQNVHAPVFFVSGNHEEYAGMQKALRIVKKTKIRIVDDAIARIGDVQIVGLGYRSNASVLKKLKVTRKPSILLRHMPIPTPGFDLQLSGHTHHGQLWPLSYLVLLQFPVISGEHNHTHGQMYVSQGTGTWGPPFRLGSRGEITLLKIVPEKSKKI